MKASVIIPTYNRALLLSECMDSWIKQSIPLSEYEIIVVDNNSKDTTCEVVSRYMKEYANIRYVKELRPGLVYGRHAGAKASKSECLIYADDDGLYNETCIEEIMKVYRQHPEVSAVGGKIHILWDGKPEDWLVEREYLLGRLDYGKDLVIANNIYINGGLFSIKKNILYELNGFNPDQIGDYLVGDGESGLCIKMHKKNHLIAWTPHAIMLHQQFLHKQGTKKDIGRRYYNYGVCISYGKVRNNNFRFDLRMMLYLLRISAFLIKDYLEYAILWPTKKNYATYFKLMHKKGEFVFFKHLTSKQFVAYCKSDNWF